MLVDMTLSEKPFLISTGFDDVLKKRMNLKPLKNINIKAVFKGNGRFVRDNIIK